jgi:dethiobiotin synthetase
MNSSQRLVLLGTGTDVGKTYLGVALVRALRALGRDVLALKPVESGLPTHQAGVIPRSGDAADLAQVATLGAAPRYGLSRPVSPHLAAREQGQVIELSEITQWVEEQEQEFLASNPRRPVVLIETAGGCFSPLSEQHTNFDLASALGPARWLLIAPDSLGVLHDVQATLRALLPHVPHYLALSQARGSDSSTGTNAQEVERVVLPQLAELTGLAGSVRAPRVFSVARGADAAQLAAALDRDLSP